MLKSFLLFYLFVLKVEFHWCLLKGVLWCLVACPLLVLLCLPWDNR